MARVLHDGREDGLQPLKSLDLGPTSGLADMLDQMAKTAFGGRELGEAYHVLRAMADDPDCTIVVTVSGAMTVAKMDLVLCRMIEAGLAHLIVSTGAVMAHGLSQALGCVHYKYDPQVPDKQLYDWGYNRVYDTLEMEANLWTPSSWSAGPWKPSTGRNRAARGTSTARSAAGLSKRAACPACWASLSSAGSRSTCRP